MIHAQADRPETSSKMTSFVRVFMTRNLIFWNFALTVLRYSLTSVA